ncbi:signal peptidase II [Pseudomonas aeruginosa]|uniref:signal peptidase II n=1 Tax=Pseudomonas aeruginosa TaxID=287 RepID=UPI001FB6C2A8|nr:signal peptidase II [Pseudomonas aeruginosa]
MDEPSLRKTQWYSLAIVIFAGDQAAKSYIDATTPLGWSHEVASFFNLVHALNPGAAFSFLAGAGGWQRWFFLAIAFAISAWLAWLLSRPLRKTEGLSYSLILGGALGNAFDRATRGHVIDYIDFHLHGWHGRGLALMLAPTAAFAATPCCDGGDCCNDVAMPCCE